MAKNNQNNKVSHLHLSILALSALMLATTLLFQNFSTGYTKNSDKGFDEYGYNYTANLFNGKVDGADRNFDGTYWGDTTYANDKLKMTWSKAWDEARFDGKPWTCDAWTDNQWNGKSKDGSGETWHYKIVWVGPEAEESECWREGGYSIWNDFEVIFSQGTDSDNNHFWDVHTKAPGYGGF